MCTRRKAIQKSRLVNLQTSEPSVIGIMNCQLTDRMTWELVGQGRRQTSRPLLQACWELQFLKGREQNTFC